MKPKLISKNVYFNTSFWGGLSLALVASLLIICNNDLYWCTKITCFSNFLSIFEFPIKVASSSLALSGFVALIHRSEQTRQQIEISTNQNFFQNFIDHKKEFMEILATTESDFPIKIKEKNAVYRKIFPDNNTQNVDFTSKGKDGNKSELLFLIESHNRLIDEYSNFIRSYQSTGSNPTESCARWISKYILLSMELGIYSEDIKSIYAAWHSVISPDVISGIPADLERFMYACEQILVELSRFCFPNGSVEISINRWKFSGIMNNLVDVYCVQDGRVA